MVSTFEDIFSRFYQRVEDYNLAGLEEDIVKDILSGYIKSVISKPYVRKLFSSIVVDTDVEEIEYTMRESWGDDVDQDFVEEMVALGCVVEWIRPRYHSVQNTSQMFTNKEQQLNQRLPNPLPQLVTMGNLVMYSFEYAGNPLES